MRQPLHAPLSWQLNKVSRSPNKTFIVLACACAWVWPQDQVADHVYVCGYVCVFCNAITQLNIATQINVY